MASEVVTLIVLLVLLAIACFTDVKWQMIYNWNTYPGLALGFLLRGWSDGAAGLEDATRGFVICGGLMLVCFVLFGLGGGDLKLIAMQAGFFGRDFALRFAPTVFICALIASIVTGWALL